jgi:hypothetical protein
MPWKIVARDGRHCVVNEETGEEVACHATEAEAMAQMRALHANEAEMHGKKAVRDLLIYQGGAVKSAPDSTIIEGLLVPFGDENALDIEGEFFSAKSDLGLRFPAQVQLYYHHGLNKNVGRTPLGWAELSVKSDGVWFKSDLSQDMEGWLEGEREKAVHYRGMALKLAQEGLLGGSSGAASHVVVKRPTTKGDWIARWPIAEASITPRPANPRTFGTVALKSLADSPDPEELLNSPELSGVTAKALAPGASLADYASAVVSANEGLVERLESRLEARIKSGRVLSRRNVDDLQRVHASLGEVLGSLAALLTRAGVVEEDDTPQEPAMASSDAVSQALAEFERTNALLAGVAV